VSEKRFSWTLKIFVRIYEYLVFVMGFGKHELLQEENNRIFHHRTQNGWSKESLYIFKLLPKHLKQTTKCHAVQVHVAIKNVENLDVG